MSQKMLREFRWRNFGLDTRSDLMAMPGGTFYAWCASTEEFTELQQAVQQEATGTTLAQLLLDL